MFISTDGHYNTCTCVFTVSNILGGLRQLHLIKSSLLLHKFGRTSNFLFWCSRILYVPTFFCLIFWWMTMSMYDILLTLSLLFVSTFDSITYLLGSTLSISSTCSLVKVRPICRVYMCFHP